MKVSGIVLDKFTGDPIRGALVTIGHYRTTTNSSGRFELDVEPGSYIVLVSAEGYESATRVMDIRNPTTITFLLSPIARLL